ncbi:5' nucleotidase, deoxy (Pyrimidine), cytosolic type C protein (NT5C) [uncultured archaeon]|nr:5' nucleotidase, deoxy (Pyrimidine), cytosolic type C protein (NT5C) [uncultured archaeon]
MKIAVDIDGVLADQVGAVLNIIEKEYGQKYSKSDVNCAHWIFEGRDIWLEIAKCLADQEYVLRVPPIERSRAAIRKLAEHDVFVVTARRPNPEAATRKWLETYFPCLKGYFYAKTGTKHLIPSDVLVDDFDLNIVEFVKSDPERTGILFTQPWSRNGLDIEKYSDQIYLCSEWQSVLKAIGEIDDAN